MYINKLLSNEQIDHKLSNSFYKAFDILNAQNTQTLKFQYAQYMGNYRENTFWLLIHTNPNCTLYPSNNCGTWPHFLSKCTNHYNKVLCIVQHNKAVHQIEQIRHANKITRFLTLTNAIDINNQPLDSTIPNQLLACTCHNPPCLVRLQLNIYAN